jgi:hypothetical protein
VGGGTAFFSFSHEWIHRGSSFENS